MTHLFLKRFRQTLALLVFVLITLLFLDFSGVLHKYLSFLAKIQLLPAIMALNFVVVAVILVLTLLFGRIYCSVICPLGIMQDVFSHIHSIRKKNRFRYTKEIKWLRYGVFVLFVVALILGVNSLAILLAPYSSYGRIAQNLFSPIYLFFNNILAYFSERLNSYAFYSQEIWIRSVSTFVIALLSFVIIGFLAWKKGRLYCNSICPVGTLLSFVARFSFFKIRIDESKCIKCDKCTKNCKAQCINGKQNEVDYSRCVVCGNCQASCPKNAINYTLKKNKKNIVEENKMENGEDKTNVDISKRAFLTSSLLFGTSLALAQDKKKVDGGLAIIEDKKPYKRQTALVPPGAKSLKNFQQRCTGCQLCISKCPNNVLRPSKDLLHLMQPEMSFEKGACRVECTLCSDVCPAGAIEKITKEEKTAIKIGTAHWVKQNCVVTKDKHECGNCARHCPAFAIFMVPINPQDENSLKIPSVNENKCIGCGMCEYVCPSRPYSAIFVEGGLVHQNI